MKNVNRRAAAWLLTAAVAAGMCTPISAASSRVSVTVDGQPVQASAYVDSSSRTQASVDIGKQLGMEVKQSGKSVTFTKDGKSVTFEAGSAKAGTVTMDTATAEGYVPLKYLAEQFGYDIAWNGKSKTVALTSSGAFVARNLDEIEKPAHDFSESNQLPLTGYFKKQLSDDYANREVRYYIPDTAIIRPYYHFIAVPNQVDVDQFLVDSGWKQIADETGECLFVLMPDQATKTWGSTADEAGYIAAARTLHAGNGAYFTTFGMFYLVGYGEGAAPLEAWAAENPHLIISQAYVDGASCGSDVLQTAGETSYGRKHMTDGDVRDRDGDGVNERLDADGNQKILDQMRKRLTGILHPENGENAGILTKGDMPVPTWLVNSTGTDSLNYWKSVNKATGSRADSSFTSFGGATVTGNVFGQKEDTWATEYAGPISKVVSIETKGDTDAYAFSRALRDEMTDYTRYDNSISYGNALTYRLDYTAIQVDRFTSANKEAVGTVSGLDLNDKQVSGEIKIKALTLDDGYVTDVLLYVPETAGNKDIPVIVVWHGGSQTGHLFMDSTAWWQTAAAEGFALALPTRTNHGSGTTADYDVPIFDKVIEYLTEDGRFDMGRVYTTGQSMGCVASIELAEVRANKLAAVIASNAGGPNHNGEGGTIPIGLVVGEGNYADRGIPGFAADTNYPEDNTTVLVRSSAAAKAGADIYWDAPVNSKGTPMHNYKTWEEYFTKVNGLDSSNLSDVIEYRGGNALNGGHDDAQGSLSDWNSNNARYRIWKWYNEDNVPEMTYIFALYEAHNCLPGFRPLMWDFMKHYSMEENADGTVTRYYSASGFEKDDAVVIK